MMKKLRDFRLIAALSLPLCLLLSGPALGQESAATSLDAIVVTAGSTEEAKREVSSNITVIDEKIIAMSGAKDLSDLAAKQGLQIYKVPSGLSGIYIRGLGNRSNPDEFSGNVLILMNGHRTGTNNMSLIGLENVERIEIIRGPAAVQYGSAAMGGVVNIITKKAGKASRPPLKWGWAATAALTRS